MHRAGWVLDGGPVAKAIRRGSEAGAVLPFSSSEYRGLNNENENGVLGVYDTKIVIRSDGLNPSVDGFRVLGF